MGKCVIYLGNEESIVGLGVWGASGRVEASVWQEEPYRYNLSIRQMRQKLGALISNHCICKGIQRSCHALPFIKHVKSAKYCLITCLIWKKKVLLLPLSEGNCEN